MTCVHRLRLHPWAPRTLRRRLSSTVLLRRRSRYLESVRATQQMSSCGVSRWHPQGWKIAAGIWTTRVPTGAHRCGLLARRCARAPCIREREWILIGCRWRVLTRQFNQIFKCHHHLQTMRSRRKRRRCALQTAAVWKPEHQQRA